MIFSIFFQSTIHIQTTQTFGVVGDSSIPIVHSSMAPDAPLLSLPGCPMEDLPSARGIVMVAAAVKFVESVLGVFVTKDDPS